MSTKLNRVAYEQILKEDLAWLDKQEDCPESDHIRQIVKDSVHTYYGEAAGFDLPRFYDVLRAKFMDEFAAAMVSDVFSGARDGYDNMQPLQQAVTTLDKAFARACVAVGPPGTAT